MSKGILCVGVCLCLLTNVSALNLQLKTQLVSVGSTATKLPTTPIVGREYVLITNTDTAKTVYIGTSTVTTSGPTTGTPILPSEQYYGEWESNVDVYGITSTGSANVIVEEGK